MYALRLPPTTPIREGPEVLDEMKRGSPLRNSLGVLCRDFFVPYPTDSRHRALSSLQKARRTLTA